MAEAVSLIQCRFGHQPINKDQRERKREFHLNSGRNLQQAVEKVKEINLTTP